MDTRGSQTGAALIMLIGIIAVLAILSATLVVTIANQQSATARERRATQSFYAAEAALDTGVQLAKVDRKMSTTAEWLTQEDLQAAFYDFFPAGATVAYRVYDNLPTVNYNIKWDQGGPTDAHVPDHRMWVEATVTHQGKTTRTRALITQKQVPFAEALPKAVTYSDTGIWLEGSSDIYAVNEDGSPDTSGPPYQTSITAGTVMHGSKIPLLKVMRSSILFFQSVMEPLQRSLTGMTPPLHFSNPTWWSRSEAFSANILKYPSRSVLGSRSPGGAGEAPCVIIFTQRFLSSPEAKSSLRSA